MINDRSERAAAGIPAGGDMAGAYGVASPSRAEDALDDHHLWPGDLGTLTLAARAALLQLIRGPYLLESRDAAAWRALMSERAAIESRLADLFLELVIDSEAGVAFARNVHVEGEAFPKAARSHPLTLLDSIMVLTLRRELLVGRSGRVFIGQDELFESLEQYRNLNRLDPASFNARLKSAWTRLVEARILLQSDVEGRFEISPILKIIFGAEEAQAVAEAFTALGSRDGVADSPANEADRSDDGDR